MAPVRMRQLLLGLRGRPAAARMPARKHCPSEPFRADFLVLEGEDCLACHGRKTLESWWDASPLRLRSSTPPPRGVSGNPFWLDWAMPLLAHCSDPAFFPDAYSGAAPPSRRRTG
jgi:hypothetical protein